MATPIRLRTETLSDPAAAWDELEAGITFLEEEIHAQDETYTVTPFVPGQRTSTWVMTKAEIQGLEDRMHAVSVYLGIPHLLTTWSGLMPVGYNAMNHFILGLKPQEWIDYGFDPDGDLYDIMPVDYDPATHEIDWLSMFNNLISKQVLTDLIFANVKPILAIYGDSDLSEEYVYRSNDGGTSWGAVDAFGQGSNWCENWVYLDNGAVLAGFYSDGFVLKSTDKGDTWSLAIDVGTEGKITSFCDLGSGVVLVGTGPSAKLYRSADYGDTWALVEDFATYTEVNGLCNLGRGIILASFDSVTAPAIYRSTDYGYTWASAFVHDAGDFLKQAVYLGNGIVVFVGLHTVYRSTNYGADWAHAEYKATSAWTGFPLVTNLGSGVLLILIDFTSNFGSLYRSADSGATWALLGRVDSATPWMSFTGLISLGAGVLLASGGDGVGAKVYRSIDSGATWALVKTWAGEWCFADQLLYLKSQVASVDSDAGSVSAEAVFNAADTRETSVAALDSMYSVIAYQDSGNSKKGTAVVAKYESGALTFGSETVFAAGEIYLIKAIKIDATHVLIAYSDYADGYQAKAVIGTISGTSITFGTTETVSTDTIYSIDVSLLDANHAIIGYGKMAENDAGSYGAARVAVIDGTHLSLGTETKFNVDLRTLALRVQALSSTRAVIAFDSGKSDTAASTIVAAISGSFVAFGSIQAVGAAHSYIHGIGKIDATHAAIMYLLTSGGTYVVVAALSGTSLSLGSPYTLATGLGVYPSFAMLDSTHALVCADSDKVVDVLTFTGYAITAHHSTAINGGAVVNYTSLAALDVLHAMVVYQDYASASAGTAVVFTRGD